MVLLLVVYIISCMYSCRGKEPGWSWGRESGRNWWLWSVVRIEWLKEQERKDEEETIEPEEDEVQVILVWNEATSINYNLRLCYYVNETENCLYNHSIRKMQTLTKRILNIWMIFFRLTHIHTQMYAHAHTHTCTHTYTRTYTYTIHTYIHTYTHTYVYTYTHTYTALHIHTHTLTLNCYVLFQCICYVMKVKEE